MTKRMGLVCLALCLVAVATAVVVTRAQAITFSEFTNPYLLPGLAPGGTIGFAYAGDRFVGSVYNSGNNVLYSCDLTGGNLQFFAPGVNIGGANPEEHFVSASLGLGGFASRDIFVTSSVNNSIIHVSHDGSASNTFVSGLNGTPRGILFDAVGTFGFDMIVTTNTGTVYRINSAGNKSILASVGEDTEGLDIAPLGSGFGTHDGSLFVASEGSGSIRAITPTGQVSTLGLIAGAEELSFVPMNLGASGNPVEGFYGSGYPVDVQKAGAGQFAGFQGDMIVTGEFSHAVSRVHWNGTSFVTTNEGTFPYQPEDGIFVTSAIINPVPEPASVLLLGAGLVGAAFWRRKRIARRA